MYTSDINFQYIKAHSMILMQKRIAPLTKLFTSTPKFIVCPSNELNSDICLNCCTHQYDL